MNTILSWPHSIIDEVCYIMNVDSVVVAVTAYIFPIKCSWIQSVTPVHSSLKPDSIYSINFFLLMK